MIFVPETAKIPLESIPKLFEKDIIRGALMDTVPRHRRAKALQSFHLEASEDAKDIARANVEVTHLERRASESKD